MQLKKVLFLTLIFASACMVCCSCNSTTENNPEEPNAQNVKSISIGHCRVAIPDRITAIEETDGSMTFLVGNIKIGGVISIPYDKADQLTLDGISENEVLHDTFENFSKLIVPDSNPEYFFETSSYGSFCLRTVNNDGTGSVSHYFFPDGDMFYDVFFYHPQMATPEEQLLVLETFSVDS